MRPVLLMLMTLFLIPLATAATLQGTIYTAELEVASNILVEIDTQPTQRMLSTDGEYSFEVPQGEYTIIVTYPEYGLNMTSRETVNVQHDGEFTFDLFLLPDLTEEEDLLNDLEELDPESVIIENEVDFPWPALILVGLLVFATSLAIIMPRMHHRNGQNGNGEEDMAAQVLTIIKHEGGRITQKDLRKHLPHSEAKVSLVVAELEAKGKIEKLKKGRGNILVLK
ncbi:hypothetical protein GOV07_01805 [Candidatus Woesearchaeota archaeon]|nr:hypothetical protein [Candidatus Woesearchaeota archaeon]